MNQHLEHTSTSEIIKFHTINPYTFEFETAEGCAILQFYSHKILRVRFVKKETQRDDFSYAVITEPNAQLNIDLSIEDNLYRLRTSYFQVEVPKHKFLVCCLDLQGNVINEDDPTFSIAWLGTEVTNYKKLQKGERFIGLGEKNGNLDRKGTAVTNWNTDAFAYNSETDPMYLSTPFYMGVHSQKVYGIFLDNTYRTGFDFAASNRRFSSFKAEAGEMNYYFFYGETVPEIIDAYTHLTGRTPLPPLWSLGFQQCRYSYYPDSEVKMIAKGFRDKDIPADVIYLDIHYMEKYKVFTWDDKHFPNPEELIAYLKSIGFKVVLILDPGVRIEDGYEIYEEGKAKDMFVKYPDGEAYEGQVWPGWCNFPDFTKPEAREWWGNLYKKITDIGVEGFWNDMNEPAVWGKNFPDLVEFDYEGQKVTHKKAHNVYGMQMARSTYEGTKKLLNGKRPFVLTRAGYSGIQRFATIWTGDNISSDDSMLNDIRLINSLGMTGVAYSGYDVGGFVGNVGVDLFKRWIAVGAFTPFFRVHTMINTGAVQPWSFGEEAEEISRNYIKLRYRLMPYLYSYFYEASQTGMPIQRSLAIDFPHEPLVYEDLYQSQFFFGQNLLVCPVKSTETITKLYLPEGDWYDLFNDDFYTGNQEMLFECPHDKLPLFAKAGGMLLMQSAVNNANEKPAPTLELHLYAGTEGSEFVYYEDDGETYEYENEAFYRRKIIFDAQKSSISFEQSEGNYTSKFEKVRIYLHGFDPKNLNLTCENKALEMGHEEYHFVQPISNFDPFWEYQEDHSKEIGGLPFVELELKEKFFEVKL